MKIGSFVAESERYILKLRVNPEKNTEKNADGSNAREGGRDLKMIGIRRGLQRRTVWRQN